MTFEEMANEAILEATGEIVFYPFPIGDTFKKIEIEKFRCHSCGKLPANITEHIFNSLYWYLVPKCCSNRKCGYISTSM